MSGVSHIKGHWLRRVLFTAVFCSALTGSLTAFADARTDFLVRALRTSSLFRVRAQAALSLGAVSPEPAVVASLSTALSDENPAVRAASATSLGRLGVPSALAALRRTTRDSEAAVRNAVTRAIRSLERASQGAASSNSESNSGSTGPARFYVAVGTPATQIRGLSGDTLRSARAFIARAAGQVDGVTMAPDNERSRAATRILRSRHLTGYYLDSSIISLEERPGGGLRARVSIVVQSYPDRNIRSMLNGAATVMGASGDQARQQAIEGALRGALRSLSQALEASAGR